MSLVRKVEWTHAQFNTGLESAFFVFVCSVPTGINIRKLILSALTVWGWAPVAWHARPRTGRGRQEGKEKKQERRMREQWSPTSLHFRFNKSWVMSRGERVGPQGRLCCPKRRSACQRAEELSMTHSVESASCHSSVCLSFSHAVPHSFPTFSWLSPPNGTSENLIRAQQLGIHEGIRCKESPFPSFIMKNRPCWKVMGLSCLTQWPGHRLLRRFKNIQSAVQYVFGFTGALR